MIDNGHSALDAAPMAPVAKPSGYDRCAATTRSGGSCGRPAGWGTDHVGAGRCKLHGGCTPSHTVAARRTLAERGASKTLAETGYEPVGNPLDALADLAAQATALVAHWSGKVNELGDVRYESTQGTEQLRAEVALYERAMDRAQRFLSDWVRLGFEERKVALDEATRQRLVAVLAALVDGIGGLLEEGVPFEVVRREHLAPLVRAAIETTASEGA